MNHVVHKLKKNNFFILLQSSLGDLFKLTVDYDEDKERIVNIVVNFFDTIPVSTNISILKSGFLLQTLVTTTSFSTSSKSWVMTKKLNRH